MTDQAVVAGGSFDLADGVAGLFTAAPLQPADVVDNARIRIVSAAEADVTDHTCTVAIYATDARPATVAEAQNGQQLFSATFQPVPTLATIAGGASTAVGLVDVLVPTIYTVGQRTRRLSIVTTYTGGTAKGLVLYKAFRGVSAEQIAAAG